MAVERDLAREIAISLVGTFKAMSAHKRRLPRAHPYADQGALPVLHALGERPLRVSTLAELVHSDVSTVSRQVSALTDGGLVTKITDPQDRRAQLVSLTDDGATLLTDLHERRTVWMQTLLAHWSEAEAREFTRLLVKFTAALDAYEVPRDLPEPTQPNHP